MAVTRGIKIYAGKSNTVYQTDDPFLLELESTNCIPTSNNRVIETRALTNNKISIALFELFAKKGIPTHYVCKGSNEYSKIVRKANMIKLKVIGRFIEADKVFDNMQFELFYKDTALGNPSISTTAAIYGFEAVTEDDLSDIEDYTHTIGIIAQEFFAKFGLTLVDFKVEFGLDAETGKLILCDEFSPDTCKLWDKNGKSFGKNVFQKDLGNISETYKHILEMIEL